MTSRSDEAGDPGRAPSGAERAPLLPTHIAGSCFTLRPWRQSDRAALLLHIDDPRVTRNLRRVPFPYTDADATAWLRNVAVDPPPPGHYAIEVPTDAGPTVAGATDLVQGTDIERWCWEVGYWLGHAYWGRGIMTEALRLAVAAAWAEPRVVRLYAPVFSWNPASMRVLEKAGFRREAVLERAGIKDGTVIDRVLYALTRETGLPYAPFRSDD